MKEEITNFIKIHCKKKLIKNSIKMELDLTKYIRKKTQQEIDDNNNDFSNNPLIITQSIREYYDGTNIFVTGNFMHRFY